MILRQRAGSGVNISARVLGRYPALEKTLDQTAGQLVVFLDFDGVLHPVGEPALDEDFRLAPNPRLFCYLPHLIEALAPYPEVRIVVSSDWRRLFDDDTLRGCLGTLGDRFYGVVETFGGTRAEEIYKEVVRRGLMHWLVLDDHPSVVEASSTDVRFIACDSRLGLGNTETQAELREKLSQIFAIK